jgi:hypothetical protein
MKAAPTQDRPEFVPRDIEAARVNFGANCGPASFAAATGREVCRVMRFFRHFEDDPWTNLTQMKFALIESGHKIDVLKRRFPVQGVALIQWLGPWTKKDFFSRWSLLHTHWVAVQRTWIFDHTVGEWQTLEQWRDATASDFVSQIRRADGWAVKYGVEVENSNINWSTSGAGGTTERTELALNFSG